MAWPRLVYRLLWQVLRLLISIFFRQVEVVGFEFVPREGEGPVVFAGNHPNSLIDPAIIIACCRRTVHFAAKDVLFRSRLLRRVLRHLGAVPVARRSDHPEGPLDNQGTFDALFQVLAQGRCMGIFPEGLSHDEAQLQRLKTGAARTALGVAARHPHLLLRIIPSGLTYVRRNRFRTLVLLQFGPPIEIDAARRDAYAKDPRAEVQALTATLDEALQALTVNAADWDTLRVLDGRAAPLPVPRHRAAAAHRAGPAPQCRLPAREGRPVGRSPVQPRARLPGPAVRPRSHGPRPAADHRQGGL